MGAMNAKRIPGPVPFVDDRYAEHAHVEDGPVDSARVHNSVEVVEGPPPALAPSPYGVALAAPEAPINPDAAAAAMPMSLAPAVAPPLGAPPLGPDGMPAPAPASPEDELLKGLLGQRRPMPPLGQ